MDNCTPEEKAEDLYNSLNGLVALAQGYQNSDARDRAYGAMAEVIAAFEQEHPGAMTVGLFFLMGYAYIETKQYDLAIKALTKATELDPDDAVAWNDLGYAYIETKQYDLAIKALTKATELDPEYVVAWNNLGYTYTETKQHDLAIKALTKATELDPEYAVAWNTLGYVYNETQKYDLAIEALTKATELDPNLPYPHRHLAIASMGLGHTPRTVRAHLKNAFDRAIRDNTNPTFWDGFYDTLCDAAGSPASAEKTLWRWSGRPPVALAA